MIIDIHAHTSDHKLYGLHTSDASLDYLRREAEIYEVKKIFLMATYFPLKKSGLSNKVLFEKIKGDPLFGCFGSLDMENNFQEGLEELTRLAGEGLISGIKLYPGYQNIWVDDEEFWPLYKMAEEYHLPVAVHLGELHHCCPREQREKNIFRCGSDHCLLEERKEYSEPGAINMLAFYFPKVNFIGCHLGNPKFADLRNIMNISPNLYTDISGQFLSGTREDTISYRQFILKQIKMFLDFNGADKVLFGTDFPIQSYASSLGLIKALNLDPATENKIPLL